MPRVLPPKSLVNPSAEALQAKLSVDRPRGVITIEFHQASPPCNIDQVSRDIFLVFDRLAEGRLVSVQVVESDLACRGTWSMVLPAVIGPTLATRVNAAVARLVVVEEEVEIPQEEAAELVETWVHLHRRVAARLGLEPPAQAVRDEPGVPWRHLDRALALITPPQTDSPSDELVATVPAGFAARARIGGVINMNTSPDGLVVAAALETRTEGGLRSRIDLFAGLVDPVTTPLIRMCEAEHGFLSTVLPDSVALGTNKSGLATLLLTLG